MKHLKLIPIIFLILTFVAPAFGLITVIDVSDKLETIIGETTIMPGGRTQPEGVSLPQIEGKYLSYRGLQNEAMMWFEAFVKKSGAIAVNSEINEETGTISTTISIGTPKGPQYHYFIIKRTGP